MSNNSTNRDAIIYLPAISRVQPTDTIDAIANRLVGAFDRNAASGKEKFYLEKRPQEFFQEFDTQVYSIMQEGEQDRAVVDLYELDYRDLLTESAKNRRPATHMLYILWTCVSIFHRLIKGARSYSKTRLEKWQVFYGWLMAIIVSLYFVIVAAAFVSIATELPGVWSDSEQQGVMAESVPTVPSEADSAETQANSNVTNVESTFLEQLIIFWDRLKAFFDRLKHLILWLSPLLVIIFACLGILSKNDFKKLISDLGIELTAAENYLSVDEKRSNIRGQMASLLEHISEKEVASGIKYDQIHIISYSFGSIIALDALFPKDTPLVPRFQNIHTLTTIGTPHDFICTYWPEYFEKRMRYDGIPKKWINIYRNSDVFGSDFRNILTEEATGITFLPDYALPGNTSKIPDVNRNFGPNKSIESYSRLSRMKLIGFQNHSKYWEGESGADVNSLDIAIQEIYQDMNILN